MKTNTNLDKRIRLAYGGELENNDKLFKEIDNVLSIRYNHYDVEVFGIKNLSEPLPNNYEICDYDSRETLCICKNGKIAIYQEDIDKMENNKYEEIIEYLKNDIETLKDLVSECNSWNGSLEDYNYYENDEYFFDTYFDNKVNEAVRAVCYGNYKYTDDYVRFNAYGNLDSCSKFELEDDLKDNAEEIFDTWLELYKDNSVDTYDDDFKELVEKYNEKREED